MRQVTAANPNAAESPIVGPVNQSNNGPSRRERNSSPLEKLADGGEPFRYYSGGIRIGTGSLPLASHVVDTEAMEPSSETRERGGRRLPWVLTGLCVSLILLLVLAIVVKPWLSGDPDINGPDSVGTSGVLDAIPDARLLVEWTRPPSSYVGSEACRQCHADRVDEFQATPHFRTSRLPESAEQGEYFRDGNNNYQSRDPDVRFTMTIDDDRLTLSSQTKKNGVSTTETRAIGMIYGAGTADEVYHSWQGDKLYEMPVAYLHPLQMWVNSPGFLDGTANLNRPVVPRCLECHTTYAAVRPGSVNSYDRSSVIHGVTCERCHGPGKDHVDFHQENPDATEAHKILNPSELSRPLQLDNCGQCHSNTTKRRTAPFSFRPGDKLEAHFRVDRNERPEYDHTANHVRYLRESKCFQLSDTLTCSTCHDPHQAGSQNNSESIQRSCLSCHTETDCSDRLNLPEPVRDQCLNCHMPKQRSMSVTFDTATETAMPLLQRRSHQIAIDANARRQVLLNWLEDQDKPDVDQIEKLTDEIVDYHLKIAGQRVEEHRLLAAMGSYRDALDIRHSEETKNALLRLGQEYRDQRLMLQKAMSLSNRQAYEASRQLLSELLERNPVHSVARAKYGALEAGAGRTKLAYQELKKAAEQDPDDPYAMSMLGWLHYLDQQFDESEEYYRRALEIDPRNAKIFYQAALVSFHSGKFDECRDRVSRSLKIHPHQAEPLHLLALTLRQLKKPADAMVPARDAVARSGKKNTAMLRTLAELHADLGQYDAASEVIGRAIELSSAASPSAMSRQMIRDLKRLQLEFESRRRTEHSSSD